MTKLAMNVLISHVNFIIYFSFEGPVSGTEYQHTHIICPDLKQPSEDVLILQRKKYLGGKVFDKMRSFFLQICYTTIVIIVCSHNIIDESYQQNSHLKTTLNESFRVSSI